MRTSKEKRFFGPASCSRLHRRPARQGVASTSSNADKSSAPSICFPIHSPVLLPAGGANEGAGAARVEIETTQNSLALSPESSNPQTEFNLTDERQINESNIDRRANLLFEARLDCPRVLIASSSELESDERPPPKSPPRTHRRLQCPSPLGPLYTQ